jgi:hypothetical protein
MLRPGLRSSRQLGHTFMGTGMGNAGNKKSLALEVRLMTEPCLWRWDIKDLSRDAVVQSSWDHDWIGYASRDEAYAAGRKRMERVLEDG